MTDPQDPTGRTPDAQVPGAQQPEGAQPNAVQPEGVQPEGAAPDATVPAPAAAPWDVPSQPAGAAPDAPAQTDVWDQPDPYAQPDSWNAPDPYALPDAYTQTQAQPQYQYGYAAQQGYPQPGFPAQAPSAAPAGPGKGTAKIVAIGVAALLVLSLIGGITWALVGNPPWKHKDDPAAAATTTESGATTSPGRGTGGDCGVPGTGLASAITDRVASGPLSFPISAAPGWEKESYTVYAQSIAAAGLQKAMGDGQPWQAGAEVGQTNFSSKLDPKDAASRMIQCIADGAGYNSATSRRVEQSAPESVTVDGVAAAKVTGKILVTAPGVTVPGDEVTVIVIASAPQTYAMLVIPIGRTDMAATGQAIIDQLKVAKDV